MALHRCIQSLLPFSLSSSSFLFNSALYGKSIFILCHNPSTQIDTTQIQLDIESLNSGDLFASSLSYASFVDILSLLSQYSSTVYVSRTSDSGTSCGTVSSPCSSLNTAVTHLISTGIRILTIIDSSDVEEEISLSDLSIQSPADADASSLSEDIPSASGILLFNTTYDLKTHESILSFEGAFSLSDLIIYFGSSNQHFPPTLPRL